MRGFCNRFDGNGGRFDASLSPQIFSADYYWLPFLSRHKLEAKECEHIPLEMVWGGDGMRLRDWIIDATRRNDFLNTTINTLAVRHRTKVPSLFRQPPTYPYNLEIENLRNSRPSALIVFYNQVTRGLKNKAAWIRAMQCFEELCASTFSETITVSHPANDNLMGCFINTADPRSANWLIKQGVPVFILHAFENLSYVPPDLPIYPNFFAGSELEDALSSTSYYWTKLEEELKPDPLPDSYSSDYWLPEQQLHRLNILCFGTLTPQDSTFALPLSSSSKQTGHPFGKGLTRPITIINLEESEDENVSQPYPLPASMLTKPAGRVIWRHDVSRFCSTLPSGISI